MVQEANTQVHTNGGFMIVVDLNSSEPLFSQLINQIKKAITNDELLAGAPLPSIRQLANELDVNNKTVAKAYKLLERDNVIESKGYRGTFVHPEAKQHCAFNLNNWLNEQLTDVVQTLKQSGATDSEIRIAFNQVMTQQTEAN